MKRFIGLILTLALVLQLAAIPVHADGAGDTESWSTMECFGVVQADSDKNGTFTVADMSEMLYHLLNIGDKSVPEATRQIYTDVDRWHNAAGYIEWLYLNDVYMGDGSGKFEPDRTAMLSDVCGVMLNLLGYGKLADLTEDTADPITKAIEVNILPKSVKKTEHEITYGEFAAICREMLFTDVVKMSFSTEKQFIKGGEFIEEVLDLRYGEGVITGAGGYSFLNDRCERSYAVIGNKKLYAPDIDVTQYIGYNVKYYCDKDDKLVGAVPVKNEEIVITSADEPTYSNNTYKYEKEKRYKRAKTDTGVMLLYNGKPTASRTAFVPSYGSIRLIDNDRDGSYDCVIVEDVFNIVLERASNGVLYGKNGDNSGKKYTLDTEKIDLLKMSGMDGKTFEDLPENTVITVAKSEDGKYVSLYVTEKTVSGVLSKYDDEGIAVDDVEYDIASGLFNPNSIVLPGNDVTILFDVYGNAAAVMGTRAGKYKIGYLMDIKINDEDERLVLKILTEESSIKKIACSTKLYIDDAKPLSLSDAESRLTKGELIKYVLNGDEIRSIDTALHKAGSEKYTAASDSDSLRMFSSGKMIYKSYPQVFKKYGTMSLGSEFAVDDNTLVFFVPSDSEYRGDEDYYVASKNYLANDLIPDAVYGYVTGEYEITADAVVVVYNTIIELATSLTVVDRIYKGLNSDDEIITVIKGMSGGKSVELTVSDSSVLGTWGTVAKGSVIRCRANKNGDVRVIDNLYALNGTGLLNTNANHTYSAGSSGVNANVRIMLGRIYSHDGTLVQFDFKDNVSDREVFNLKNCNFYVYDETDGLRLGTADDIRDVQHYGTLTCDEVIICTRAVATSDVILIKKN